MKICGRNFLENGEFSWKNFVLNRDNAKESTGHGSPLPTLMHGGPGRAGGGEEMGGLNGLHFFLQKLRFRFARCFDGDYQSLYKGAEKKFSDKHPFQNILKKWKLEFSRNRR